MHNPFIARRRCHGDRKHKPNASAKLYCYNVYITTVYYIRTLYLRAVCVCVWAVLDIDIDAVILYKCFD